MPCSGPRGPRLRSFSVERARIRHGIGIDIQDRVQARTGLVVCGDAVQIELNELNRRELTGGHRRLEVPDALFENIKRLGGDRFNSPGNRANRQQDTSR